MMEDLLRELIALEKGKLEKEREAVVLLRRIASSLEHLKDRMLFLQPPGGNVVTKLSEISSKLSTIASRLKK